MIDAELKRALDALELYRGYMSFSFPAGYEENLLAAAERGQDPDQYQLELDVQCEQ